MKKKELLPLWTQEAPDICRFCAFARVNKEMNEVYCEKKKKYLSDEETCRKFKYDILKKELRRRKQETIKHDAEEFEI